MEDGKGNSGRVTAISAAIRGGNFNNGTNAGVFALNLNNNPGNSNYNIGFRACKRLSRKAQAGAIFPALSASLLGALILAGSLAAKHKKRERGNSSESNSPCSTHFLPNEDALKSYTNLYPQVYDFENLHLAYTKARKNKRYKPDVLSFSANLEENLIILQNELIWKTYRTSPYRQFYVYEPKQRLIMALPFRDRVIHHALCNVIAPIFEKSFIYDSYACLIGKGIHKASTRLTQFLRTARTKWGDSVYCLKLDVSKFFPTVNHHILASILKKKIQCPETLWLMDEILFSIGYHDDPDSRGLPIGNLTSQLWANVYLNELDLFAKEELRVRFYLRYMDDIVVLYPDKGGLWNIRRAIEEFLRDRLKLRLNIKTSIFPTRQGIDFVGYRTWPDFKLIRKSSIKRAKRRFKNVAKLLDRNVISLDVVRSIVASWIGYCTHGDAFRIRHKMLAHFLFRRESWRLQ